MEQSSPRTKICPVCKKKIPMQSYDYHFSLCQQAQQQKRKEKRANKKGGKRKKKQKEQVSEAEETFRCPLCDHPQTLQELDTHPPICPNREDPCPDCNLSFPRNIMNDHRYYCRMNPRNRQPQAQVQVRPAPPLQVQVQARPAPPPKVQVQARPAPPPKVQVQARPALPPPPQAQVQARVALSSQESIPIRPPPSSNVQVHPRPAPQSQTQVQVRPGLLHAENSSHGSIGRHQIPQNRLANRIPIQRSQINVSQASQSNISESSLQSQSSMSSTIVSSSVSQAVNNRNPFIQRQNPSNHLRLQDLIQQRQIFSFRQDNYINIFRVQLEESQDRRQQVQPRRQVNNGIPNQPSLPPRTQIQQSQGQRENNPSQRNPFLESNNRSLFSNPQAAINQGSRNTNPPNIFGSMRAPGFMHPSNPPVRQNEGSNNSQRQESNAPPSFLQRAFSDPNRAFRQWLQRDHDQDNQSSNSQNEDLFHRIMLERQGRGVERNGSVFQNIRQDRQRHRLAREVELMSGRAQVRQQIRRLEINQIARRSRLLDSRPMRQAQINKIPDRQYFKSKREGQEDQLCSICYMEIENDQQIKDLKCKHLFHTGCITQWMTKNSLCPQCRGDMKESMKRPKSKKSKDKDESSSQSNGINRSQSLANPENRSQH